MNDESEAILAEEEMLEIQNELDWEEHGPEPEEDLDPEEEPDVDPDEVD